MKEKNSFFEIAKNNPADTILNFGLVWKGKLETFEDVKRTIIEAGDLLIYQTKSTGKIFIKREEASGAHE